MFMIKTGLLLLVVWIFRAGKRWWRVLPKKFWRRWRFRSWRERNASFSKLGGKVMEHEMWNVCGKTRRCFDHIQCSVSYLFLTSLFLFSDDFFSIRGDRRFEKPGRKDPGWWHLLLLNNKKNSLILANELFNWPAFIFAFIRSCSRTFSDQSQ